VPVDEDFGMSPVESMSCGTPVIGVNDGGLKESIIDGATGILIDAQCLPNEIQNAIQDLPNKNISESACVQRGHDFSLLTFTEKLRSL
jgi:glycosyltransferase involved in cell wall biosynthesis